MSLCGFDLIYILYYKLIFALASIKFIKTISCDRLRVCGVSLPYSFFGVGVPHDDTFLESPKRPSPYCESDFKSGENLVPENEDDDIIILQKTKASNGDGNSTLPNGLVDE